jgi:hypothetical protein
MTVFKRYPMLDLTFVFQGQRTKKVFMWHTVANIEAQALEEARDHLARTEGEPMVLLSSESAVAKRS